MHRKKIFFFLKWISIIIFNSSAVIAQENLKDSLLVSLGMVNISLSENTSVLEDDLEVADATVATVTPISAISLEFTYNFKHYLDKAIFSKAIVPLLSPEGSGYYMGGVGINFFPSSLSSIFSFSNEGTSIQITPTTRYYYGGFIGGGYLVYNTEFAKKSDLCLDLSLHGGATYNLKKSWALNGEIGLGRVTGIATTGIAMKIFFGGTYYLP